jgi:hypothetical protein
LAFLRQVVVRAALGPLPVKLVVQAAAQVVAQ